MTFSLCNNYSTSTNYYPNSYATSYTPTTSFTSSFCQPTYNLLNGGFSLLNSFTNLFSGFTGSISSNLPTTSQTYPNTYPAINTSGTNTTLSGGLLNINYSRDNADCNVLQVRNTSGQWCNVTSGQNLSTISTADMRLYNQTQGTYVNANSAGAKVSQDAYGNTTIAFEDRYGTCKSDNDYNDVTVTISRGTCGTTTNNTPNTPITPNDTGSGSVTNFGS